SFKFRFYIFDLNSDAELKFKLNPEDKDILEDHRVYLYRDNVRVYPYGEPDDDWLQIDVKRGTISTGGFFSNKQLVGEISITQKGNPELKDKTNREGLIEKGNATKDFITLIQTFLSYIRRHHFEQYRQSIKSKTQNKKEQDILRKKIVDAGFKKLRVAVKDYKKLQSIVNEIEKDYAVEKGYLVKRAETTEELAGVGLSVETASHDIMAMLEKVISNLDSLINDLLSATDIDKDVLLKELQSARGGLGFVQAQLKDIQLLFKSSKQKRKAIRIKEIVLKVKQIYQRILKKENISIDIRHMGSPLIAKTTDAVLLQLIINLMDNSIFWLKQVNTSNKRIEILLDGDRGNMIFSDNGPGINKDDAPYIFEAFYSGKGQEGRGLGLYIARRLLERQDYSINLAEISSEKKLSGANFVVNFISGGQE
ncbi:MAG: hypothetical protein LBN20_00090, partial [Endomicrobium sp.]|nr:hypothetical protein [Endomicrobium sp.]